MAFRRRQEAEPVLADAGAGMDDHTVADQCVKYRRAGADAAIAPDRDTRADDGAGGDHRASPNLGPRSNHDQRVDDRARLHPRRRMDVRTLGASTGTKQRGRAKRTGK